MDKNHYNGGILTKKWVDISCYSVVLISVLCGKCLTEDHAKWLGLFQRTVNGINCHPIVTTQKNGHLPEPLQGFAGH